MTEEQVATAVIAALNAASAAAYDLDDIANMMAEPAKYGTLPNLYTEATTSRRYGGGPRRQTAQEGTESYRVTTRAVAKTVSNARVMRARATTALQDVCLTIDGHSTTPIQFESAEAIGPDDGWYSGLTAWTFTV